MNIIDRIQAPTPDFFKKLRNIGLGLAAISGVVLTAPIALPAAIVSIAGYVAVAGGVIGALSQVTTTSEDAPVSDAAKTEGGS